MSGEAAGPIAVDRLLAAYLGASGALALLSLRPAGLLAAAAHLAATVAVLHFGRRPPPRGRWAGFVRAVYPIALTPALYAELGFLNQLWTTGYLDAAVQGWEEAVFGGQPSLEMARHASWLWLSEFLHLGYFAYYLIVPAALFGAFATRGAAGAHRVAFQTGLAFFGCYLVFALFPVAGPRYLFPPIGGPPAEGTAFALVHAILEGGSSKGTAFPSSHIAAAWAAVLACRRVDPRWSWLLAAPAAALAVGTVYGRFHYAVDAVAGVGAALLVHALAPALVRRLGEWPRPAGEEGAGGAPGNPGPSPGIQPLA